MRSNLKDESPELIYCFTVVVTVLLLGAGIYGEMESLRPVWWTWLPAVFLMILFPVGIIVRWRSPQTVASGPVLAGILLCGAWSTLVAYDFVKSALPIPKDYEYPVPVDRRGKS